MSLNHHINFVLLVAVVHIGQAHTYVTTIQYYSYVVCYMMLHTYCYKKIASTHYTINVNSTANTLKRPSHAATTYRVSRGLLVLQNNRMRHTNFDSIEEYIYT